MLNKMELAGTLSRIFACIGLKLRLLSRFKWLFVTTYFRKIGL